MEVWVAVGALILAAVTLTWRITSNTAAKSISKQVEHLDAWTGDQEKRVRDLEIGREGCLQRLKSIEEEQRRTTEAIRDLTKEVRAMNGRRGTK